MNTDVLDGAQADPMNGIIDDVLGITADREAIIEEWRERYIQLVRDWLVWVDEHRADLDPKFTSERARLARSRERMTRLDQLDRSGRYWCLSVNKTLEKTVAVIDALEGFLAAPGVDTFAALVDAARADHNEYWPDEWWKYVTGLQPFESKWLSDMIDAREFQIAHYPLL